jgi:biotin carboxylase
MPRVLLIAATTGYQIRSFGEAAERLGVELVLATDRCHVLDDPWRDNAIAIRFKDEVAAVEEIRAALIESPVSAVLAVGDRPALIAALTAETLKLRGNPPNAVRIAGNKLLTRIRLREAELPVPWFTEVRLDEPVSDVADWISFPCVVKPLRMSASRGVMRVDTLEQFKRAIDRIRRMLERSDVEGRDPSPLMILVEQYLPGGEVAVEGVVTNGVLQIFAIFDKPDPLEGPFFEETIYVTPSGVTDREALEIRQAVSRSVTAFGLTDGPVHAECRIGTDGVFVLEVAPRPIGGLCSKALQFLAPNRQTVSLEEVLLRQALAQSVSEYRREDLASGVMMIPIPRDGLYKNVVGLKSAREVDYIEKIVITAHRDQRIRPLPEGGSYLGFIFARAELPAEVESALRSAHRCLEFEIAAQIQMV